MRRESCADMVYIIFDNLITSRRDLKDLQKVHFNIIFQILMTIYIFS
jgi:hypothetical protein